MLFGTVLWVYLDHYVWILLLCRLTMEIIIYSILQGEKIPRIQKPSVDIIWCPLPYHSPCHIHIIYDNYFASDIRKRDAAQHDWATYWQMLHHEKSRFGTWTNRDIWPVSSGYSGHKWVSSQKAGPLVLEMNLRFFSRKEEGVTVLPHNFKITKL